MSKFEDVGIEALTELALNMRWSWNRSTDELWSELDPELWALTHNPRAVLQTVSPHRIQDLLARPDYRQRVKGLIAGLVSRDISALSTASRGVLQHGVRAQRSAADLLGWPRQHRR
jgi:glucan phosphorylase